MADDLSLLFRLRSQYDSRGTNEARAAVKQLQQSFGPELSQTVSVANKVFSEIGENLNSFVGQRIPLFGNAFVRVTETIKGFNSESGKTEKALEKVSKSIQSISAESGKSVPQIASFLARFVQIEGQAKRDASAVDFFGAATAQKLIPQLEKAGTELATVASESTAAGAAIGGMALPVTIAAAAIAVMVGGVVLASREIFQLTKYAAEFQGRMFDLAQQTGISVETLSALEIVAKTTGGEIGNLTNSIVAFQRRLEESVDPSSKAADTLRRFNISAVDTELALRQAFTALAAMPEGFTQTSAAAELFGARGGKQILAILKETNGDLDGAIRRFRELGILIDTDSAAAADRFNDELELLNFQIRALTAVAAEDLIPALAGTIEAIGELVRAVRPLIAVFGVLAGVTARQVTEFFKGLQLAVRIAIGDYTALAEAIKKAREEAEIPPLVTQGPQPVPLPGAPSARQTASEALSTAEAVVGASKRAAAAHNEALNQLFEQGRINRQQQAREVIADIARVTKAETDAIDERIKARTAEFRAEEQERARRGEPISRDSEAFRKHVDEIRKLQEERLNKEADFERQASSIRARAAKEDADSRRNQEQNATNIVIREFERQIKEQEAAIERGQQVEADGLTIIEQLEQAKIGARRESLERQREIGFLTVEAQREINDQVQALDQEADQLRDEQLLRRLAREKAASERLREIKLLEIDAALELQRSLSEQLITTQESLAELRVQSEERTAQRILAIRLALIDQEIEAVQAKLEAAKSITDVNERARIEAELRAQLKILDAQRAATKSEGNRAIDAARQEDLQNERDYADELERIRERTESIERDTAEEVIRLMRLHFADRKTIIRAQRDLELAEEEARHTRVAESIRAQQGEVDAQIATLEKFIERLKPKTDEEIAEYDRLIQKLEALRQKRLELNQQQESETERTNTTREVIKTEAQVEIANPDESLRDVFDDLGRSVADLTGKFADLLGVGGEFSVLTAQIAEQIGGVLAGAFDQFASALGQTAANWVLLGETGPAVMRKILAQALASLAAEATVQAIKELALGFATLFFNPAESAAHFTAAGLWASIGGAAALAGRGIAGDLFKSKTGGIGERATGSQTGQIPSASLARNAGGPPQPVVVNVNVKQDPHSIVDVFTQDFRSGGQTRQVVNNDGGAD